MKRLLKDLPGEKQGPQLSREHRPPSNLLSPTPAWGQRSAQSSSQQGLQTQDWVCEPPPSSRRSRHWSLSIDERRGAGVSLHCQEIMQIVAQLVSEDVDKDVLIPHPPRSSESTHAFHAFLARSSPFWQNVTLEP
ncbi:testis-expressed protein 22 [Pteropus alecto]|uniref:testis-expressed protein 22 n=1 Tax=Pteropus alecto TaxID=9402 RepID=UPI0003F131A5|nr:testis-expressed protein 22 [Pteropus alecto]